MHCYKCNKDVPDASKHCPYCGKPLEVRCLKCNKMTPNGTGFCSHCGQPTEVQCEKCHKMIQNGIEICPHCGNKTKEGEAAEIRRKQEDENYSYNLLLGIGSLVLAGVLWYVFSIMFPLFGLSSGKAGPFAGIIGWVTYLHYHR